MEIGTVLEGKYEILKKIGEGGMSNVYLAMDVRLNKQWAVKEIKPGFDREFSRRILKMEVSVLRTADHPVLPRIVDILEEEGSFYLVMDYIEGTTMDKVLKEEGAQPQEQVVRWAKQLNGALLYLHSLEPPVIYRDMKPSNIMRRPDGSVKLIDFGTAKEVRTGSAADTTALGTRGYAAPEQFGDQDGRGKSRTDERTDIYCLGATLHHMLTGADPGKPPYERRPLRDCDPSLSGGLEVVIGKCIEADPDRRYQSCRELMQALDSYEKLDESYRRNLRRKGVMFSFCLGASLFSAAVSFLGYRGIVEDRDMRYESAMADGDNAAALGKYEDALRGYTRASEADETRAEPCYRMLGVYREMGKEQEGLSRAGAYALEREKLRGRDDLLFEVASRYFYELEDYGQAMKYFRMIPEESIPEAACCYGIAKYESRFVRKKDELRALLKKFEVYLGKITFQNQAETERMLTSCRILVSVYASNINDLSTAFQGIIKHCDNGIYAAGKLKDSHPDKSALITDFNRYLAMAWEWKGDHTDNAQAQKAAYERAAEYSGSILKIAGDKENAGIREQEICRLAGVYEKLGNDRQAEKEYQQGIKEMGTNGREIWILWLDYLCRKEEKKHIDPSAWERTKIRKAVEEGGRVKGIAQDIRWKKLLQKLRLPAV